MHPTLRRFVLPALVTAGIASAAEYRVTLPAAPEPRAGQVIVFPLPADVPSDVELRGGTQRLPVQREADGTGVAVVPQQAAGEALTFSLRPAATGNLESGVATQRSATRLRVTVEGKPMFDFQLDRDAVPRGDIKPEFKRAGYIHPVFSPAGKIVTDDYPSNHVHHHGIWTPWTKTSFQGRAPDFWNMGTRTGREDLVALDRAWSGNVQGGFEARLQMIDLTAPTPVVALNESWRVLAYRLPPFDGVPVRMFDLIVTQTCATSSAVQLPMYHYGGFGFRGAGEWNGQGDAALFLTSEGVTDRIAGNNSRARWCYLGGPLEGAITGTAVLGHPQNLRAPQPVRLHPDMPYFSFVPQQLGQFAIEPGRPYVARFRFIVADGAPDRARLEAFWQGYANPAVPVIEPSPSSGRGAECSAVPARLPLPTFPSPFAFRLHGEK